MKLSKKQYDQVKKQLENHNRDAGVRKIVLDEDNNISVELFIEKGVFGSDIMSSAMYLAKFLYEHQELYIGKSVLDLGCGPGTQGIVMATYGAKLVTLSDINQGAVANAEKNIVRRNILNAEIYLSDLFNEIPKDKKYGVVVFNHPFFSDNAEDFEGDPNDDVMLRKSMLGGEDLIKRFFRQVSDYLNDDGIIIMPYFHFAGVENDPKNHVADYDLKIIDEHSFGSDHGLQLGDSSIYIISKDKA